MRYRLRHPSSDTILVAHVQTFTCNPFQTNCFVCHDGQEAVIVDASCQTEEEQRAIVDYIAGKDLTVRHLLLTHTHIDHVFGCAFLAHHYDMEWLMHRDAVSFIQQPQVQSLLFGMPLDPPPIPDRFLQAGDTITFGNSSWKVLLTPGHAPGSISFYDASVDFIIAGDVLFMDSIGRTDLPGGSRRELEKTIFETLLPLGDATILYPGHGPSSTLGRERKNNPFLNGNIPII